MSNQINFLLDQALGYIRNENLDSAELILKQIIKVKSNHSEALRLYSVIATKQGRSDLALERVEKAILADKRNGIAYSNLGNIYLESGFISEAIASYEKSIKLTPLYAESYSNLGNAYQELGEYQKAIDLYKKAIAIESNSPEFFCNLGNAYWKLDLIGDARQSYEMALRVSPQHINSHFKLADLDLCEFKFSEGWNRYEARWFLEDKERPIVIKTTIPRWDGVPKKNRLLIWGEQGIGDQILFASMLNDLASYPQLVTVSVDRKLIPLFQRAFPRFHISDKDSVFSEDLYDEQIPIGSLGNLLRPDLASFSNQKHNYLITSAALDSDLKSGLLPNKNILCGLSWKSGRAKFGKDKSISLVELAPILNLKNVNFINLQYGEVSEEISQVKNSLGVSVSYFEDIDLFEDVDSLLSMLGFCDIVVTSSNSTAHLAGALGKETLLILPFGNSKFWYWHDIDGVSLWYPSIRVFKQEKRGDWSVPIQAVKAYLEKRFAL